MNSSKLQNNFFLRVLAFVITIALFVSLTVAKAEENRSFTLDLQNGHVAKNMKTITVTQGDRVELNWNVDKVTELHLHGYNIKLNASPTRPKTMIFVANFAGRFPVSIHGSGSHGKVIYLEVYPR